MSGGRLIGGRRSGGARILFGTSARQLQMDMGGQGGTSGEGSGGRTVARTAAALSAAVPATPAVRRLQRVARFAGLSAEGYMELPEEERLRLEKEKWDAILYDHFELKLGTVFALLLVAVSLSKICTGRDRGWVVPTRTAADGHTDGSSLAPAPAPASGPRGAALRARP